jgi:hypothetical protein
MTAINEHGELDPFRASEIVQGIEGGAGGAAAEKDVIHQDDRFIGDVEGDGGWMQSGRQLFVDIIPVHVDVEGADGHRAIPDPGERVAQATGEVDATTLHTDEHDFGGMLVAFRDFVSDPLQGAMDREGVQDLNLYFRRHINLGGAIRRRSQRGE